MFKLSLDETLTIENLLALRKSVEAGPLQISAIAAARSPRGV
jgi:hypothetical protein